MRKGKKKSTPSAKERGEPRRRPLFLPASKFKSRQVEFVSNPYIPRGKLVGVEGDPEVGKSTFCLAVVAAVTTGIQLPGQDKPLPPHNAVVLNAEDSIPDTVKPRLERQGADLERVLVARMPTALEGWGLQELDAILARKKPLITVIDPLVGFMPGGLNLNRATDTRKFMSCLGTLAQKHKCSFLLVRHLTKSARDRAIYRAQGSIDVTAACRSVLLMGRDARDEECCGIVHIKCNVARKGPSLGYRIENGVFRFTGEIDMAADDVLAASEQKRNRERDDAKKFLRDMLADKPKPATALKKHAEGKGISLRTLERAKNELGVVSKKKGKRWIWKLP